MNLTTPSYRCCHPQCPGYPYKASEMGHPPTTCTDEGRARSERARAVLDELFFQRASDWTFDDMLLEEALAYELIEYHGDHWRCTDLGHECLRLLSEGSATDGR